MINCKAARLSFLLLSAMATLSVSAQISLCRETPPGSGNFVNPITNQKCITTIQTAVPFLMISPDARSGAMGDVGAALSPTAASTYWNASALAQSEKQFEIQAVFTPWLQALNLDDVYLANLSAYGKLDELQTLYGSLRYFSLGTIEFTDNNGTPISTGKPYEMALSFGYARKLTEKVSASLTGRFILSSLASGLTLPGTNEEIGNGTAGAADLSFSYVDDVAVANGAIFRTGVNISNIGSKISYTQSTERDYLPANLRVGSSLETFFDDYNSLTVAVDFNKLLVPSPILDTLNEGSRDLDQNGRPDYLDKSPIEGIFSSFGDAQGGFSEEIAEISISAGLEYWYAKQFAARIGYFHEANTKGGRQYLTVGVGVRYNVLGLDFSYLVPTSNVRNPLDNTLRIGLNYAFVPDSPDRL